MDPLPSGSSESLASLQVEAMVTAWRKGERPLAEHFMQGHPELGEAAAIRLIFEEFCLRQEAGMEINPADFARRFPRWWADLELLFDCHRLMDGGSTDAVHPQVGEDLAGFRLLAELGRGVLGRVFLASERALADRPVVIKVAPSGREEHLSLARLQHMNIVPLYSAQVLSERRLQVLCMPFLGGASLAQVLDLLKDQDPARRTGDQLIDALDRVEASLPVRLPARGPFRRYLARSSYVEAICWIGICLADGLQYAHDRNFVHMDIKPSNVLLTGDGQPMLLDFHLAREPIAAGDPAPRQIGGTPGTMAPEQADAMAAVSEGRPILAPLDGRADLFSLGLMLYEALGGPKSVVGPRRPLHRGNPRVPVGLSDIIDKCLRPGPSDRYPTAADLAADLRRFLEGLPLQGVSNRSLTERWRNWRRRRPHALTRSLILIVSSFMAVSSVVVLWAAYLQRVREVEAALEDGRASLHRHQYPEATNALKRGLALANYLPAAATYRQELEAGLTLARRDARAEDLHQIAELIRFRYGIDPPPAEEAQALILRGEALWKERGWLMTPVAGHRDPEVEARIRADLLDFALAWANLRVRSAPAGEADTAKQKARRMLDEADTLLGPCAAIERERQPDSDFDRSSIPRTAGEHFELGKSYLRSREFSKAAEQFRLGLGLRPQDFWLNFYEGLCAYRLGRFDESVSAFRVCIALAPDSAECYFNRGLAFGSLGRIEEAIEDYTRALRWNPSLTSASLNRGILRYQAGHLNEATIDLEQALRSARSLADLGRIHYNLALIDMARKDRPTALSNLKLAEDYGHEAARDLRARLQP